MRNAFIEELVFAAEKNPRIALVVGDLGYGVVEPFAQRFPTRFFNSGVAEQNMMGFSAGLASEGFHVFVYSIANFPTFRCAEQVRNDVDYHQLPVTIVAVGGGVAYGNLGYSHHAVQDYALLRSFPNMLIAAPGDPLEVRACLRYLVANPQPSYLRLGKAGEPNLHEGGVPEVVPGRWLLVRGSASRRKALLSTGTALELALGWSELPEYNEHAVYSLPLWGMQSKVHQITQLQAFDAVTTLEDHLIDGGFGSWLLEVASTSPGLAQRLSLKALSAAVCGTVGSQSALNLLGGIAPGGQS